MAQHLPTFQDLINFLGNIDLSRTTFVGLGNPDRCDDGAGLWFLSRLQATDELAGSHFIHAERTPENHLHQIAELQPDLVVFIDAAHWGGEPGEIAGIFPDEISFAGMSTHSYSLSIVESYLKSQMPVECKFVAIEPWSFELISELSAPVHETLEHFFTISSSV